jgi:hypothetical protein
MADSAYDDVEEPKFAPGTDSRPITPEELKAFEDKSKANAVGAAPTPGFALSAKIQDGKMYDPSGREVSSIGATPQQAAEQFGATLPMGQQEMQKLSQLEQGYNDLLRNPNIDPRAKHNMLHDMARQIQYGHWRMAYQLSQDRMQQRAARQSLLEEQIQGRHQVSANEAGLMGANADHFSKQIQDLQQKFPDHDVEYSSKTGIHIKPKAAPKGKPEKEADPVQAILTEQKAVKSLEPTFAAQPESVQKMFKEKYGDAAAAHGWALERLAEKKKEAAAAKSAAAAQSGARRSTPRAAAQSGAAPTSGQPLFPTMQAAKVEQTRIQDWAERQHAAIKDVSDPMELKTKQQAIERATELLGKRVSTQAPLSPAEADELARMGQIIENYKAAPKRSPLHFLAAGYEPK